MHDDFEQSLRDSLAELARQAPAAPSLAELQGRLRRRRRGRLWLLAALLCLAVAGLRWTWPADTPRPVTELAQQQPPAVELPDPLPAEASELEVRRRLQETLRGRGILRAEVSKTGRGPVSFVIAGAPPEADRGLLEELEQLLRHYDRVQIELSETGMRCSLLRLS